MKALKYSVRPRTVFLEILHGCNLYCSYCYIGRKQNHAKPFVPPIEVTMQILDILKNDNVEEIVLLGGEPTLHPRFTDICRAVASLDFPHRGVVTNGTAITQEKAQLLKEAGFWVDISFRGPNSNTFDTIAGKAKSFQKAFDAAILLSNLGISVGIEFDCVPQNYDGLFETINMLVRDGIRIKQVQLHRIMPEGDAEHNMTKFFLTLDQWHVVFEQAAQIQDRLGIQVIFEDGFPFCLVQHKYRDMITPCPCGFTLLTVSPTGDARYCPCHKEILGNVLRDSLSVIWERRLRDYRSTSRLFDSCLECDLLAACRGGCSASGHTEMNVGMDIFHEHFRSIKLDSGTASQTKLIFAQSLRTYQDNNPDDV